MNPTLIAILVVAALVIIAIAVMVMRSRERERLQKRFGPEYDRQVEAAGGSHLKAETELLKREKRVQKLELAGPCPRGARGVRRRLARRAGAVRR